MNESDSLLAFLLLYLFLLANKLTFRMNESVTAQSQNWHSRFTNTTTTLQRQPPEGGPSAAYTSTLSLRHTKAESNVLQQMPLDEEQRAVRSN